MCSARGLFQILAQAFDVIRAVDYWQRCSGHYFHQSFPIPPPFSSLSQRMIIYICKALCVSVCSFLFFVPQGTNNWFVPRWTNIFASRGGRQTFFVRDSGGFDDVDEQMDVSEAINLSAGARIFICPQGHQILVQYKTIDLSLSSFFMSASSSRNRSCEKK